MNDAAAECFREIVREDFHFFRDTMEGISTKLESIAENVGQILSQHMTLKKPSDADGVANAGSILCVQKHNSLNKERNHNVERGCSYRALGLHLATEDLQFRVTSGSRSVSFDVPGGCLVITVGEQLQEWSGGDLEMVTGEAIFEPNEDAKPSYLIEFMCSPSSLNVEPVNPSEKKIISLMDQLLIILSLTFLHLFWTWISSVFAS
ncbi:hypothetical protein QJS10_CPB21g01568 [Acorus calamus]|uniref:Uncharacterized protein n=1 Tax=Acorus calamus TaxID=4465 RepID=A0AAV9C5W4_ACOCL|nr:hypothetical protein QJS10_CPB21g01568 [Acorus calamus]